MLKIILRSMLFVSLIFSLNKANELVYNKQDTFKKLSIVYDLKTKQPITGSIIIRYVTGEIWRTIPYVKGKEHGVERWYFKPHTLRYEITYKEGKQDGLTSEYNKKGELIAQSMYKNDEEVK